MQISKKQFVQLLRGKARSAGHRVKRFAHRHKGTIKTEGLAVAGGAAAALVHDQLRQQANDPNSSLGAFFVKNWWAEGAGLAVAGHFIARKWPSAGHGVLGAAGFLIGDQVAGKYFKHDPHQQQQQPTAQPTGFVQTARGLEAYDASALVEAAFSPLAEHEAAAVLEEAAGISDVALTSDFREASAVVDAGDMPIGYGDASDALDL
jgi:hypothetical protein